ncbi:transposase [Pseudonocardia sp. GCM10023141]|uniref:transposase n=1 Tax=Pseudonocardia sp. GCM10023141 TaxID=3252653 RepID=UPI0036222E9A
MRLPLLDQISVGRDGPGRPRKRPERVLADKACSDPSIRTALRRRGIAFTSPEKSDQIARRAAKGSRGGRPPAFDPLVYADRNVVERCFNRLKQFRGLAIRYATRAACFRSEHVIAAIVLWLRTGSQDTAWARHCRPVENRVTALYLSPVRRVLRITGPKPLPPGCHPSGSPLRRGRRRR